MILFYLNFLTQQSIVVSTPKHYFRLNVIHNVMDATIYIIYQLLLQLSTDETADILPLLNLALTSTDCGISPILNVTLLDSTAHDNYIPYQNFSYSTIWSWAPGEPRNYTSSADASSSSLFRCASTTISSSATDYAARWIVSDCSSKFFAACRAQSQPYNWTITTYPISYSYADQACSGDYDFAAPRTALENSYLSMAMRDKSRDYDGHGVWVDFNSLNVEGCWTTGGPNATCPYSNTIQQADDLQKKIVLVCCPFPRLEKSEERLSLMIIGSYHCSNHRPNYHGLDGVREGSRE
jgi:hypothetical protein